MSIIDAIHEETVRYRDAQAEQREEIKESLLDLRTTLNSVIIRLRLAQTRYSDDSVNFKLNDELMEATKYGALQIDRVSAAGRKVLTEDTYSALQELVEECVFIVTSLKFSDYAKSKNVKKRAKNLLAELEETKEEILKSQKNNKS